MRHFKTVPGVLALAAMVACTDTPIAPDLPYGIAPLASITTANRITKADVLSFLHSFGNGTSGLSVTADGQAFELAAPADGSRGRIIPFNTELEQRFCTLDWSIALIGGGGGGSYQATAGILNRISNEFTIDGGDHLETIRTPVTRRRQSALRGARSWSFGEGAPIAPGDLTVGEHTLLWVFSLDGEPLGEVTNTFFIDPSGSTTCTG